MQAQLPTLSQFMCSVNNNSLIYRGCLEGITTFEFIFACLGCIYKVFIYYLLLTIKHIFILCPGQITRALLQTTLCHYFLFTTPRFFHTLVTIKPSRVGGGGVQHRFAVQLRFHRMKHKFILYYKINLLYHTFYSFCQKCSKLGFSSYSMKLGEAVKCRLVDEYCIYVVTIFQKNCHGKV